MTRLDQTLSLVRMFQCEKRPPFANYEIVLLLAGAAKPMTLMELAAVTTAILSLKAVIRELMKLGHIRHATLATHHRHHAYELTPTGQQEAQRLLTANLQTTPA